MESPDFSGLSSLRGEFKSEDYVQPHYKESYRLAIDHLVSSGRDKYQEFLKEERIGGFLTEDELLFITENTEQPPPQNHSEEINGLPDNQSSSGTYWPLHSDVETPNLDLGWPEVMHELLQTNIDLLFHPPRQNSPTIKEVIRKHIQNARQVIAIVMDKFTDVDIFKETVEASVRGVPVYILLDDFHLKSFFTMAENQDVKLQHLRNMRVRTVKGQDYLCRSGARFHGAMEDRFLVIDCHTAIYGSYSFTWSFEKINLSMVQIITGHLVKSYDEEFRTLYARSTVPAELCPTESLFQRSEHQMLPNSHSAPKIERRDQLRHTLDTVFRKTCERKFGTRDIEERLFEENENTHGLLRGKSVGIQNQFQSPEEINFLKRYSYAGERQDFYVPQNGRVGQSHWNISRDPGNGANKYSTNNYLQMSHMHKGQNLHQSYNGIDKQVLAVQQNMPTLENTSKSFMRTWRIESYLKNPDVPYRESSEYLDQSDKLDKANSFMQGRMRSSLAFRSTIPEQMEPDRLNNSFGSGTAVIPNTPLHYSSMQWNPAESRLINEEFMLKRQSLQILDDFNNDAGCVPGKNAFHSTFASLGRPKGGHMLPNPDILMDSWQKRHSVADPRSNMHESSGHMCGALANMQKINRSTAGLNIHNGGYPPNWTEDQRSASHHDVKNITGTKTPNPHIWQENPYKALSAAVLEVKSNELRDRPNHDSSHHFLKKSSKKIRSLLNIPEKKEDSLRSLESSRTGESMDTLTGDDEEKPSSVGHKLHRSTFSSVRSSLEKRPNKQEDEHLKSKPRFKTEDHQHVPHKSHFKMSSEKKATGLEKSLRPGFDSGTSKNQGLESRLYSRFEPFCSFDNKTSVRPTQSFGNAHSQEKTKHLPKGEAAIENNIPQAARGHHENKLEKFLHRVGNLIHKNK
ncbi:protein FAM83B [Pholidichthys leucotaenia]